MTTESGAEYLNQFGSVSRVQYARKETADANLYTNARHVKLFFHR